MNLACLPRPMNGSSPDKDSESLSQEPGKEGCLVNITSTRSPLSLPLNECPTLTPLPRLTRPDLMARNENQLSGNKTRKRAAYLRETRRECRERDCNLPLSLGYGVLHHFKCPESDPLGEGRGGSNRYAGLHRCRKALCFQIRNKMACAKILFN